MKPVIKTLVDLEKWIKKLKLTDEEADAARRRYRSGK